jgi:quinol monooxygenase YgiN
MSTMPQSGGGPVYTVTYIEVAASAAAQAAALARQFAAAGREAPGNVSFEAFAEIGRASRLAMLETWQDQRTAAARAKMPADGFRDPLQAILASPFAVRAFDGLSVAGATARGGRQAVWVLTHVDVFPAGKDQAVELVGALAKAGRMDDGNLRFDVLQQSGRPNHFTVVEGWRDGKAFAASVMAAHRREFRQRLTPLEGALYDERLYRALR